MSAQITRRGALLGGLAVAGGALCTGVFGVEQAWALDTPSIINCDGWGAKAPRNPVKVHNRRPAKILIHHTATSNVKDYSKAAAVRLARNIQSYHINHNRWSDSGQHFTISRGGYLLEGRHRSLEMLRGGRRMVEGAHCTGQNIIAVGIENEGTYSTTGPTTQQWNRLRQMCAYVCKQYRCGPPRSTATATSRTPPAPATRCTRCCPSCAPRWPRCSVRTPGPQPRPAPRAGRCCGSPTGARTCRRPSTCCARPGTPRSWRTAGSTGAPPTPCAGSRRSTAPRR